MLVFQCYKDAPKDPGRSPEWRWRLLADNNKVIADSGEGYVNFTDCDHAIQLIQAGAATSLVVDGSQTPWKHLRTGPVPGKP
jgi:uncharacterized protein YegP (UPF0339 family)